MLQRGAGFKNWYRYRTGEEQYGCDLEARGDHHRYNSRQTKVKWGKSALAQNSSPQNGLSSSRIGARKKRPASEQNS